MSLVADRTDFLFSPYMRGSAAPSAVEIDSAHFLNDDDDRDNDSAEENCSTRSGSSAGDTTPSPQSPWSPASSADSDLSMMSNNNSGGAHHQQHNAAPSVSASVSPSPSPSGAAADRGVESASAGSSSSSLLKAEVDMNDPLSCPQFVHPVAIASLSSPNKQNRLNVAALNNQHGPISITGSSISTPIVSVSSLLQSSSASASASASSSSSSSPSPSTTPTSSSSSSSSSSGGNVDQVTLMHLLKEQDMKKQRLARKAELARMSRKRKKMRLVDLEAEVDRLNEELALERKKRKVAEEKTEELKQKACLPCPVPGTDEFIIPPQVILQDCKRLQDNLRSAVDKHLQVLSMAAAASTTTIPTPATAATASTSTSSISSSSDGSEVIMIDESNASSSSSSSSSTASDAAGAVSAQSSSPASLMSCDTQSPAVSAAIAANEYVKALKTYTANTVAHASYMRTQLELLLPMQFLEWAMNQSDRFFADPSGLWNNLCNLEIGLNADQQTQLLALRASFQQQKAAAQDVEVCCARVKQSLHNYLGLATSHLDRLAEILSPEQLAKYLSWVDRYGSVCVKINL